MNTLAYMYHMRDLFLLTCGNKCYQCIGNRTTIRWRCACNTIRWALWDDEFEQELDKQRYADWIKANVHTCEQLEK